MSFPIRIYKLILASLSRFCHLFCLSIIACFTMLCSFLLYGEVNQLCIHISLSSRTSLHPTVLVSYKNEWNWVICRYVIQSQISQKEKNKYHLSTHICGLCCFLDALHFVYRHASFPCSLLKSEIFRVPMCHSLSTQNHFWWLMTFSVFGLPLWFSW